jgi:hypothetical protein
MVPGLLAVDADGLTTMQPQHQFRLTPPTIAEMVRAAIPALANATERDCWLWAPSTLRGYKSDWREFRAWCAERGLCPLPADGGCIAMYLTAMPDSLKVGSLQRRSSAIGDAHRAAAC